MLAVPRLRGGISWAFTAERPCGFPDVYVVAGFAWAVPFFLILSSLYQTRLYTYIYIHSRLWLLLVLLSRGREFPPSSAPSHPRDCHIHHVGVAVFSALLRFLLLILIILLRLLILLHLLLLLLQRARVVVGEMQSFHGCWSTWKKHPSARPCTLTWKVETDYFEITPYRLLIISNCY